VYLRLEMYPPVGVLCLQLHQDSRLKLQILDAVVVINHVLPDDKVKIVSYGLNKLVTLLILDHGWHAHTYTPPDYQEVFMPWIAIAEDDVPLCVALDVHLSQCILKDHLLVSTSLFVLLLILVTPYRLQDTTEEGLQHTDLRPSPIRRLFVEYPSYHLYGQCLKKGFLPHRVSPFSLLWLVDHPHGPHRRPG